MAENRIENLRCPKCNNHYEFKVFEFIDIAQNPELEDFVKSGDVFFPKCPHCTHLRVLSHDLLYIDMSGKFIIKLIHDQNAFARHYELLTSENTKFLKRLMFSDRYKVRIVNNIDNFIEKLGILSSKYDDRIIELTKAIVMSDFISENPDTVNMSKDKIQLFVNTVGDPVVTIILNGEFVKDVELPEDIYELFNSQIDDINMQTDTPSINYSWALNYLHNMNK